MRNALLLFLLLPFYGISQSRFYFSGDVSGNFGKFLEYTGYSVNVSGNAKLAERLYGGIATGILKVQPFIDKLTVPLSARITFYTTNDDEKIAPFGLFEVGKLFYEAKNYGGISAQVMEGRLSYFAGVGVKLPSAKKTHAFFAIGYAGYNYDLTLDTNPNSAGYPRPYDYRRVAIKAGIMLPR